MASIIEQCNTATIYTWKTILENNPTYKTAWYLVRRRLKLGINRAFGCAFCEMKYIVAGKDHSECLISCDKCPAVINAVCKKIYDIQDSVFTNNSKLALKLLNEIKDEVFALDKDSK